MINFRTFSFIAALLLVSACATNDIDDIEVPLADDAYLLYEKSLVSMRSGNYQTAIKGLEQLDSLYPFGPYSHQAQLSLIYAYHMAKDSESALAAADRFIRQNPNHANVDYAYYMKGLTNFNAEIGAFKALLSADAAERDASTSRQSFADFAELIRKYPNSKYAPEARQRMVYLKNRLAQHELHIANYYMQRNAYMAAANRAQYVVENYPQTPAVGDALVVMATAYEILNLPELADKAKNLLKINYPDKAKTL